MCCMSDKIFVFHHTSDTIQASRLLVDAGIDARTISVPDWLSFECGVSLVTSARDQAAAEAVLSDSKIVPAGIYDYK